MELEKTMKGATAAIVPEAGACVLFVDCRTTKRERKSVRTVNMRKTRIIRAGVALGLGLALWAIVWGGLVMALALRK